MGQTTYDKIEQSLFKDKDEIRFLTPREEEIRKRMMLCVAMKMEKPLIEDSELVSFLMNGCGGTTDPISQSQAYRDLGMIHRLVGNISLAAKSWYRYMIVEGAKKAYAMAIDKGDAKGAAAALDKLGKYTRADKEDDKYDFERMIPPSFEPSDDVTLIEGLEPIANLEERRKELRRLARNMALGTPVDVELEEELSDDECH